MATLVVVITVKVIRTGAEVVSEITAVVAVEKWLKLSMWCSGGDGSAGDGSVAMVVLAMVVLAMAVSLW